jgi:hypothetical protein
MLPAAHRVAPDPRVCLPEPPQVLAKVLVLLVEVHLLAMLGVTLRMPPILAVTLRMPPILAMLFWHLVVRVLHLFHVFFLERTL